MDKTKYTFTKKKTMLLPGIRMAIVSVALLAAAAVNLEYIGVKMRVRKEHGAVRGRCGISVDQ